MHPCGQPRVYLHQNRRVSGGEGPFAENHSPQRGGAGPLWSHHGPGSLPPAVRGAGAGGLRPDPAGRGVRPGRHAAGLPQRGLRRGPGHDRLSLRHHPGGTRLQPGLRHGPGPGGAAAHPGLCIRPRGGGRDAAYGPDHRHSRAAPADDGPRPEYPGHGHPLRGDGAAQALGPVPPDRAAPGRRCVGAAVHRRENGG